MYSYEQPAFFVLRPDYTSIRHEGNSRKYIPPMAQWTYQNRRGYSTDRQLGLDSKKGSDGLQ
jgi:hypothetical protein